jgi:hypothetical protein
MVDAGGVPLGPAYGQLLAVFQRAHQVSPDVKQAFVAFRDRLNPDREGLTGFHTLNLRFFKETDLSRAIVDYVREDPDAFVSAAR